MSQKAPHGEVLSPTLFNIYMSSMPEPSPEIKLVTYDYDCTIMASGLNIDELTAKIKDFPVTLHNSFNVMVYGG